MGNVYVILDTKVTIVLSSPVTMIVITTDAVLMESAYVSKALQERTVASKHAPMTVMTMVNVWMANASVKLASQVKTAVS